MAEVSAIEWTHATFNPWRGCTAISAACAHCYAKVLVEGRLQQDFSVRTRAAASTWKQPLAWNRKALREGRRLRVFCASLADVFDNQVPEEWRADLWALIAATPNLDWLLLTKRPQNIARMLPSNWADGWSNVWLGATTESRPEMLRRGPILKAIPARVHFWSAEPLLGDLGEIPTEIMPSWVITGGESGRDAQPTHPDWFRSIRDQCAAAGVPFLFKQWGEWLPAEDVPSELQESLELQDRDGYAGDEENLAVLYRVGKKAAGRHLDGVLHDGYPVGA